MSANVRVCSDDCATVYVMLSEQEMTLIRAQLVLLFCLCETLESSVAISVQPLDLDKRLVSPAKCLHVLYKSNSSSATDDQSVTKLPAP